MINKILKNLKNYNVQFIGYIKNGKRYIHCSFFPSLDIDDNKNWKKETVFVLDGGFWYWSIDYCVDDKKCYSFGSNGYA